MNWDGNFAVSSLRGICLSMRKVALSMRKVTFLAYIYSFRIMTLVQVVLFFPNPAQVIAVRKKVSGFKY